MVRFPHKEMNDGQGQCGWKEAQVAGEVRSSSSSRSAPGLGDKAGNVGCAI